MQILLDTTPRSHMLQVMAQHDFGMRVLKVGGVLSLWEHPSAQGRPQKPQGNPKGAKKREPRVQRHQRLQMGQRALPAQGSFGFMGPMC